MNKGLLQRLFLSFFTLQAVLAVFSWQYLPMMHAYHNVRWYMALAALMDHSGGWNVWTPYPPLFPYLLHLVWHFAAGWNFLTLWRVFNFILLCASTCLVFRMRGANAKFSALAFVLLALSPCSAVTTGFYFDQFDYLPMTLLLAATWAMEEEKIELSAALAALGAMTKIFPAVLLPLALMRPGTRSSKLRYAAIFIAVCALAVVPGLLKNPAVLLSTIVFSASRPGWESIWTFPHISFPPIVPPSMMSQLFVSDARPLAWLSALCALAMVAGARFAGKKSVTPRTGVLQLLLIFLFFSKGISTYFIYWFFPLLFVCFEPIEAFTIGAGFLLLANIEFWAASSLQVSGFRVAAFWGSLFLRQAAFLGLFAWLQRHSTGVFHQEKA